MMSKEDCEDYESTCYQAFLDRLIMCDGFPGNKNLAIQIINELKIKFSLLDL